MSAGHLTPSAQPFPWTDTIAMGLGVLRLSPHDFWSMTPREFSLALRGATGLPASAKALAQEDLTSLMRRYPDQQVTPARNARR